MLRVNPDWIELAAADVDAIPDQKLREMILFALKCSRAPQSLAEADYAKLRSHGLELKEMVEIIRFPPTPTPLLPPSSPRHGFPP